MPFAPRWNNGIVRLRPGLGKQDAALERGVGYPEGVDERIPDHLDRPPCRIREFPELHQRQVAIFDQQDRFIACVVVFAEFFGLAVKQLLKATYQ